MTVTILVLLSAVAMFITGKPRADIVALCALTILVLCGILSPAEALSGFSNPVVVMMAGLFVVGGAILQTGLAKAASRRIMQLAGSNDTLLCGQRLCYVSYQTTMTQCLVAYFHNRNIVFCTKV